MVCLTLWPEPECGFGGVCVEGMCVCEEGYSQTLEMDWWSATKEESLCVWMSEQGIERLYACTTVLTSLALLTMVFKTRTTTRKRKMSLAPYMLASASGVVFQLVRLLGGAEAFFGRSLPMTMFAISTVPLGFWGSGRGLQRHLRYCMQSYTLGPSSRQRFKTFDRVVESTMYVSVLLTIDCAAITFIPRTAPMARNLMKIGFWSFAANLLVHTYVAYRSTSILRTDFTEMLDIERSRKGPGTLEELAEMPKSALEIRLERRLRGLKSSLKFVVVPMAAICSLTLVLMASVPWMLFGWRVAQPCVMVFLSSTSLMIVTIVCKGRRKTAPRSVAPEPRTATGSSTATATATALDASILPVLQVPPEK